MFASTTLIAVFTLVFTMTGVYSLARLSRLLADADAAGDRPAELFHLVMSLAMIGMAVAWTGGPETASGRLQIVVFCAFTLWFAYRFTAGSASHGHLMTGHLVAMGAAMTWMVATMTVLMGHTGAGGSGHGGHHGAPSDTASVPGVDVPVPPAPGWVVAVTIAFAVLFAITGCSWAAGAVRASGPAAEPDAPGGTVATRTDLVTSARVSARLEALCHCLMSLGMAGMLVAML
ncbi:MAG: DUF5134 domain-containing protein [Actinophytocola sp.]|uniref:DUF5134 domain-containing protein n=1 Tax=Actinophytocola sp. TaxID=1872138 RepID=UPI003C787310